MGKKRHFKGNNSSEDRKRRRDAAEKWKNTRQEDNKNAWGNLVTDNARFDAFYKAQNFTSSSAEDWDAFLFTLKQTLPACFRIASDTPFAADLKAQLLSFMGEKLSLDDKEIDPVEPLHWYPNGCGYKLGTDRRSIRKLPALNQLHKWMVQHTDNGNITRQEAVSMVPPIALDVQPHHRCLDMCAAPGSKTSQLLEVVNRSLSSPPEQQGLVVANDADTDRAYMLVHQCKRINSPLLTVTTHKGQLFPTLRTEGQHKSEFFDRVLCDVPCSGDGTLRKNPAIWSKWNTSMGVTLHPLQLMIARRGLQLVKKGGLMVYSTCSMSPYENESVVAELLRSHGGALELVDARQFMPLFKARAGLQSWYVLDDHFAVRKEIQARKAARQAAYQERKKARTEAEQANAAAQGEGEGEGEKDAAEQANVETAEAVEDEEKPAEDAQTKSEELAEDEVKDFSHITDEHLRAALEMGFLQYERFEDVPKGMQNKFRASLFPPTAEEREWMHLERCLRCVPQDEDTGGFFVATFRKVDKPAKSSTAAAAAEQQEEQEVTLSAEDLASAEAAAAESATAEGEEEKEKNAQTEQEKSEAREEDKEPEQEKATKATMRGLVEFFPWDTTAFEKVQSFYQFDAALGVNNFFIREDLLLKGKQTGSPTGAKSIYFIPRAVRDVLEGDENKQLKVVVAGVKVFEKKVHQNGEADYRLIQEGLPFLLPHIQARRVNVSIQDFCNILGGGLVSYSTLSPQTIRQLCSLSHGVTICTYKYDPADYLAPQPAGTAAAAAAGGDAEKAVGEDAVKEEITLTAPAQGPREGDFEFHAICWRGSSRTVNVMCPRIDIDTMKHQLAALGVLRPKIMVRKEEETPASAETETATEQEQEQEQEQQVKEELVPETNDMEVAQ